MTKLLLFMILAHIIDDFVLQPICLSSMKQRCWWEKNAPDDLYKNDYKMALAIHSMSWSIMILFPFLVITWGWEGINETVTVIFVLNATAQYIVDDLKANQKKISLWTDQIVHMCQIVVTWLILSNIYLNNVH
ncbi:MAG: DUF3307 domain-containing protein [Bacilli bacterium]|nr:DUF3307 domain-containing protein [Bacilli bacterium]